MGDMGDHYGLESESEVSVESGGVLEFVQSWQGSDRSIIFSKVKAELQRDAGFRSFIHTVKGKFSHHNLDVNLPDHGAFTQVYGLYSLKKDQYSKHFSLINHLASHTESEQLFKGILQDESQGMFTGDINIHPRAGQVQADQLNKNLC